jgi:NAD(P)H-dependent FMN reductase
MITIISGTNRKGSRCKVFARQYSDFLGQLLGEDQVQLLALEDISQGWMSNTMYQSSEQNPELAAIQDQYILAADAFVFISPEYNGSFPGVLKLFIDACTIREYAGNFKGKKAALLGVATGRAGNLRGMGHLAGILHYLGTATMPNQLPISSITELMNEEEGAVNHQETLAVMRSHAEQFVQFVGAEVVTEA